MPHILNLRVRYFQDSTPWDVPCREENFTRLELDFCLPVEQTALVLVDLWDRHHIESWLERAAAMTKDIIAPLIEKARETGLTIIFAPSPSVIDAHRAKYRVYHGRDSTQPPAPAPTWPPEEFLGRQGQYEIFRDPRHQPPGIQGFWESKGQGLDMSPLVKIRDGDFVVATGQQMHDLCEERRILHLLYVGFATNWCILGRDYGVGLMRGRGYNTIILRDATEGVEFPDTLEKRWATELAIREVEQRHGFSASNVDFYAACDEVRRKI